MIEARGLTKRYGDKLAVDGLDFTVHPGVVTGFLGPNGSGKSTTMRLILGLDAPTAGTVTVDGRSYAEHPAPLGDVGALLEARSIHTGRSARNHLLALAATHGIGARRVDELIDLVGLGDVAGKRVGGFLLGMGQRLGIAAALLGDPSTIILDEPVNGLDPEGVRWVRTLLRDLAAEGRTVFLSSHLMAEMAQTAHHVIVVGRGRLIADVETAELLASASSTVVVRSPDADALAAALAGPDVSVAPGEQAGVLHVRGVAPEEVGETARRHGLALYELRVDQASLEDVFMALTSDSVEYRAATLDGSPA
ncbi:MAG TPA: ATP-binding cassette domain-containing protein [Acidimicrobiales bacterium]|nr:ATP-binding cassette domain-containing protein [Acidimicrobiales bacterium]